MAKQKEPITGILIDPVNRTITAVQVDYSESHAFLQAMYKLLDCGTVEAIRMQGKNSLWVDEEGLFKRGNPVFAIADVGQGAFVGRAIVLGDRGSSCCDTKLTVEQVEAMVQWTNKVAAM